LSVAFGNNALVSRVNYDANSDDAGGDCSNGFINPARGFPLSGWMTALVMSEKPPPLADDGKHCRERTGALHEVAGNPP
jgi:hypothetical protein